MMSWRRYCPMSLCLLGLLVACGQSGPAPEPPVATRAPMALPAKLSEPTAPATTAPAWQARLPSITVSQVSATLKQANEALARGQLERGSSPGPGALELYLSVLLIDPASEPVQQGLQSCLDALLEHGRIAMRLGNLSDADRIENITRSVQPEHLSLGAYRKLLTQAHQAQAWVDKAQARAKAGQIIGPKGDNALEFFQTALDTMPEYRPAIQGRSQWHGAVLQMAWKEAQRDDFHQANEFLLAAQRMQIHHEQQWVMALRIFELRQARTLTLLAHGNAYVEKLQLGRAQIILQQVVKIAPRSVGVTALRKRINLARHYGPFKPGQVFSEPLVAGKQGPEMVVIAHGRFTMGSPADEREREGHEGPQHPVNFARGFAISRNEITVSDFARFIAASRYKSLATRRGHSTVYDEKGGMMNEHNQVDWTRDYAGQAATPTLPVVHVAFEDALAYARWLSKQTGQRYRLISEAEFEYVLRAGSTSAYAWGTGVPGRLVGNLTGEGDRSNSGRHWDNGIASYRDGFWGPAPVGSFPVERFGTLDLIGNVAEWTQDCWHDSYQRAPNDGSAWVNPGCKQRVVRGASWANSLTQARSAYRQPMAADSTNAQLGFRVAREL